MTRFELPAEIGGPDAAASVQQDIQDLRDLLRVHCAKDYSSIGEFCVILRVSGRIADYGREGLTKLRHDRKSSCVSVEVIIPSSRWFNQTRLDFRTYLLNTVKNSITECVGRLREKAIFVDGEAVGRDLEFVRQLYLRSRT